MKINVGIIGGAGYTGGEALRILIHHPQVELTYVHSKSNAGNPLYKVHQDLVGDTDIIFSKDFHYDVDAIILCLGHGDARVFLEENPVPKGVKIVDLSTDFRHKRKGNDFVYGLPELNKEKIKNAEHVANPGCFATCIQVALLPMAANDLIKKDLHVTAVTGSTGAGQKLSPTSHFSWRNNNMSVYKAFEHQHLQEIGESLTSLQPDFSETINFVPVRGDFTRGIMASVYTDCDLEEKEIINMYKEYYKDAAFTHVVDENPNLKQVVNTNKALVYVKKPGNKIHIISMIDNLAKGASGQAVQNLNIMFGLDEKTGLNFKSIGF